MRKIDNFPFLLLSRLIDYFGKSFSQNNTTWFALRRFSMSFLQFFSFVSTLLWIWKLYFNCFRWKEKLYTVRIYRERTREQKTKFSPSACINLFVSNYSSSDCLCICWNDHGIHSFKPLSTIQSNKKALAQ